MPHHEGKEAICYAPDGHATGLLGLPAVLDRLSDPSHRCQGLELTCLLQALCKQLISAASDTNLAIFSSADRSRAAAAQAAAAHVTADLLVGAPEQCVASPRPFVSSLAGSCNGRTSTDIEAPVSLPTSASANSTPPPCAPGLALQHRALAATAGARSDAGASRRPPAGPSKTGATTTAAPAAPNPTTRAAAEQATTATTNANASTSQPSNAPSESNQSLTSMVTAGIALLVDHLEHFHYRAKAVALDGLLSLSAVALGPDRRLDPVGVASLPLPATASSGAPTCSNAAAAAAVAAAAALAIAADAKQHSASGCGADPAAVADAVQALGGLSLGDWLALRIINAGAVPRLLEMLTQRTGINFVPVRQLASQVVHNLARRRNAAVRAALARWRPLPGLISGLDVVLEDSPEIAARLLLVLSDLFPITAHQIAGVLHKLIAKHQDQTTGNATQQQPAAAAGPLRPQPQQPQVGGHQDAAEGQHKPAAERAPSGGCAPERPLSRSAAGAAAAAAKARGGSAAAADPAAPPASRTRRAKAGAPSAEPAGPPAARGALAGGPAPAAASRPRRLAAMAAAVHPLPAAAHPRPPAAAPPQGPHPLRPEAPGPAAVPGPGAAATAAATVELVEGGYLGLAPDVDVPLENLLIRVTGYYMRLSHAAVMAPTIPAQQPPTLKTPFGEVERREYERALLAQRLDEHRRRRKEAGQLDCCVAALLAAAPFPNCLFDALSYSHIRAFATLVGPPLSLGLTGAASGSLWRAQDLLPYALTLIQSLGGGSDTGDGGSVVVASRSAAPTSAAAMLLPSLTAPTTPSCKLQTETTTAVTAALDRFWGLGHLNRLAPTGRPGGAGTSFDCPGPALPFAPYGDHPVSSALMQQCIAVIRAVLERAIQSADALPAAASAAAAASATASGSLPAGVLAAHQACVEAPPLAVLRSVGLALLSITRSQVAERVLSLADSLERLTDSLGQHTGSAAACVEQARMALGLANIWASVYAAAMSAKRVSTSESNGSQEGLPVSTQGPLTCAGPHALAPAGPLGDVAPPEPQQQQPAKDSAAAEVQAEVAPTGQLRRSARIKRRREGAAAAAAAAVAGPPASDAPCSAKASGPHISASAHAPGSPRGSSGTAQRDAFLASLVNLIAMRLTEVRQLQESLDLQLRQQPSAQEAADAAAAASGQRPGGAASAAGGGSWLAAAAAAVAAASAGPAERARMMLEAQALLLQAVALLMPGLDAAHAQHLADAGVVSCCARVLRSAATAPPSAPASTSGSGSGAGITTPAGTQVEGADALSLSRSSDGGAGPSSMALVAGRDGASNKDTATPGVWNDEPLYGVSAVHALGLLIQLLHLAGSSSHGTGGVEQPEVLAALGGALLRHRGHGGESLAGLPAPLSGQQPFLRALEAVAEDGGEAASNSATSRCWDLLRLMASGERPCAYHDAVLQLLVPLAALTHGPSERCAAARSALVPVLLQVTRWGHSRMQRRRLFVQVMALWSTPLQPQLLQLPRMTSPVPEPQLVAAYDGACPLPVTVADTKAHPSQPYLIARSNSQSTMPYNVSRGGRFGTPTNSGPMLPASGTSGATHGGQRTPPWGVVCTAATGQAVSGSAATSAITAAAAATGMVVMSPTRHTTSSSGFRTATGPPAINPARPRRGSRLAAGLVSPPPAAKDGGVGGLSGVGLAIAREGEAAGTAVAAVGRSDALAPGTAGAVAEATVLGARKTVSLRSLCELLEATMEHLADTEVLRHLQACGWLRALCHGVHCADTAVRESCLRSLGHAARALGASGRPVHPLLLAELETDSELKSQLSALDAGAAALLLRRQQEPLSLPPRGPDSAMPPPLRGIAPAVLRRLGPCQATVAAWLGLGAPVPAAVHHALPPSQPGSEAPAAPGGASTSQHLPISRTEAVAAGAHDATGATATERTAPGAAECDREHAPVLQLDLGLGGGGGLVFEAGVGGPPQEQQQRGGGGGVRGTRRRGGGGGASTRGRKGGNRSASATAAAAAAARSESDVQPGEGGPATSGAAVVEAAGAETGTEAGAGAGAAVARNRSRKAAITRRVRSVPAPERPGPSSDGAAGAAGGGAVEEGVTGPAVPAAAGQQPRGSAKSGPIGLVAASPLPKRRRLSEEDPVLQLVPGQGSGAECAPAAVGGVQPADVVCAGASAHHKSAVEGVGAAQLRQQDVVSGDIGRLSEGGAVCGTSPPVACTASGQHCGVDSVGAVVTLATVPRYTPTAAGGVGNAPVVGSTSGGVGGCSPGRNAPLDLQLTAREATLAAAVRSACISLESALAARRHDVAAARAAEQAASAAAAAANSIGQQTSAASKGAAAAPPPAALAPTGAKKKVAGRPRVAAGSSTSHAVAAAAKGPVGTRQAHLAASAAQVVTAPAPPAAAAQQLVPAAVADEEFLSRTYRGVSKRLNFDDM